MGVYFGIDEEVTNYRVAAQNDHDLAAKFHKAVHQESLYMVPFIHQGFSSAHTLQDIENALDKVETAVKHIESMK